LWWRQAVPKSIAAVRREITMAHTFKKTIPALVGMALGLSIAGLAPASAAPLTPPGLAAPAPLVEPAQIFRRGRPPIYPYYYAPGRPGGRSFYFGFVPYAKGDFEVQALQRRYPETNWPPSMRAWTPQSGF
jgi:hypothetical protein